MDDDISDLASKISTVSQNIKLLEEYLVSTTHNADDLITELNMLKEVKEFYLNQLREQYES